MRARDRRQRQMDLLQELSSSLPLDQSELDYSTLLRLTVAFFKTKKIVQYSRQGSHDNDGEVDQISHEAGIGCDGRSEVGLDTSEHGGDSREAEGQHVMCRVRRSRESSLQHLMVQVR